MAGAGYKLFATGDVLSASEVNTYLMQQTVMSFASSAARTTALASVLAEGMVTYLQDTNVVEIYTGSAWVSLDDPNAIQNSIVTAKGDIIGATASSTPSRLAVGANNTVLTADSSTATGLKWATPASSLPALVGVNLSKPGTTTSLTAGVISYLTFTTEIYDTNGFHDNSTNTTRITIPAGYGGKYLFTGFIGIGGVGSNSFEIFLWKNGAANAIPGGRIVLLPNNAGNTAANAFCAMIELVATDYIELGFRVAATSASYSVDALFQATYLGA